MHSSLAWEISDTFNGLMMIPNLIGVIALSPLIIKLTRNYTDRRIKGKDIEPMLSFDPDIQRDAEKAVKKGAYYFIWFYADIINVLTVDSLCKIVYYVIDIGL